MMMGENVKFLTALLTTTVLAMGSSWAVGPYDDDGSARTRPFAKRTAEDAKLSGSTSGQGSPVHTAVTPKNRWLARHQESVQLKSITPTTVEALPVDNPGTVDSHDMSLNPLRAFADIAAAAAPSQPDDTVKHPSKRIAASMSLVNEATDLLNTTLFQEVEGLRRMNVKPTAAGVKLLDLFARSNTSFNNLGVKAESLDRFVLAEYLYTIGDQHGDMTATMNLAHLCVKAGKYETAIHCYEYLSKQGNQDAKAFLAKLYGSLEEMKSSKAEEILCEGASIKGNAHACIHYANRLKSQKQYFEALKFYSEARKAFFAIGDGYSADAALTNLADVFKLMGNYDTAITLYRGVLKGYPNDEVAAFNLAEILEELGGIKNLQEAHRLLTSLAGDKEAQTKAHEVAQKLSDAMRE
jgi:tetratricopeptide (TPR) repeat protein